MIYNILRKPAIQNPTWILQLLEYEVHLHDQMNGSINFFGDDVLRARRAYRLQRDFDASFTAVAMMMDLLDEVQLLRKQAKQMQIQHH